MNPDEAYVKVKMKDQDYVYYLAAGAGRIPCSETETYDVLETYKGKDLEYKEYEPLLRRVELKKKAYYVVCDPYVTMTDGTGVVHIAPAFGEDDSQGRTENMICRSCSSSMRMV